MRFLISLEQHVHRLIVERTTAIFPGQLMSLINEKVVNLQIRLAYQKVQEALRRQHEDEVMLSLQSNVPGSGDHFVVVLGEKALQILVDDLFVYFIYQGLRRNHQSKIHLHAMLNLVLDVHPYKEGFTH